MFLFIFLIPFIVTSECHVSSKINFPDFNLSTYFQIGDSVLLTYYPDVYYAYERGALMDINFQERYLTDQAEDKKGTKECKECKNWVISSKITHLHSFPANYEWNWLHTLVSINNDGIHVDTSARDGYIDY